MPSGLEIHYFRADTDATKRGKVVEWMLPDHGKRPVHAGCLACHTDHKAPVLSNIPYLNRLFVNHSALGPHTGEARLNQNEDASWVQTKASELEKALKALDQALADKARAEKGVEADPTEASRTELLRARTLYAQAVADVQNVQLSDTKATVTDHNARGRNVLQSAPVEPVPATPKLTTVNIPLKATPPPPAADIFRQQLGELQAMQPKDMSDADFLRRTSLDLRGVPPTKVEEQYFLADKDPKKREKLVELLSPAEKPARTGHKQVDDFLADPDVAKQYAAWRKAKLEAEAKEREKQARTIQRQAALDQFNRANQLLVDRQRSLLRQQAVAQTGDPLTVLVRALQTEKRSDDQVLDAVFLATVARFPTAAEKKLVLDVVREKADKRAAWEGVAQALAGTPEAKAHAEALGKRSSAKK